MWQLTRGRMLIIVATVVGAMAVALVPGMLRGTVSGWEVIYGLTAAGAAATVVLLIVRWIRAARVGRDEGG